MKNEQIIKRLDLREHLTAERKLLIALGKQ